jgi:hypothetical protein
MWLKCSSAGKEQETTTGRPDSLYNDKKTGKMSTEKKHGPEILVYKRFKPF